MEKSLFLFLIFSLSFPLKATNFNEAVQNLTIIPYNCEGSAPDQCPSYPNERLEEFTSGRVLSQRPYITCLQKEDFSPGSFLKEPQASQLDLDFNDHDLLHTGGAYQNFGESCLNSNAASSELERIQNQLTNIGESRTACARISSPRRKARCESQARSQAVNIYNQALVVTKPQIKVSDSYLSHLKLRTGIEEAMRSVNLIGLLTDPDKSMGKVECSETPYPQSALLCESLKQDKCQQRNKAQKLREDHLKLTKSSLLQVRSLKLRKQELKKEINRSYTGGPGPSVEARFPEKFKELDSIEEKMALYTSQAPWIAGDKFKEVLDFTNTSNSEKLDRLFKEGGEKEFDELVSKAFDAQMTDNKENLANQIKDFNKAALCLRGAGDCDLEDTNEIIRRTPNLNLENLDLPHKKHLAFAQCLQEENKKANDQADLIKEIGIGVGLTVASIFVPPLGIARVAQLGATAIRGVGSIARLRAAGQLGSTAAVGAGDIYYASESFEIAYNQCTEDQTSQVNYNEGASPSNGNTSCEKENQKLAARIEHVPTECLSSLLFAGIDAIPFAAFASAQTLKAARARKVAEAPESGLRGAGTPQTYSDVSSSVGNVNTGEELLRFKEGFNDDILARAGLDGLQNYDNPSEIQAYRNIFERYLEPDQGIVINRRVNPDFIKRVNEAREVRGLPPLSDQEANEMFLEVGQRWDANREAFGTERVKLADLRSQALKKELRDMDLPEENIKDVNCQKVAKLSPGFSTKGTACFAFRTNDPQPDNMKGKFCSCGSYNAATNWLIRCPKNKNEFLRATNYYDQLGLFKNETLNCFRVSIPNNTTCFAGSAGPRRGGLGGMSQIFCPNRIQGDFKVDWTGLGPEGIEEKISSSRELWQDAGVPDDWILLSPDPAKLAVNNRADTVGESFRNYMIDWSPNPQNATMAKWVDRVRDCTKQTVGRPCDVAMMSDEYEDVLRSFADYNLQNPDTPWTIRENANITSDEFESFRRYTCQYLFKSKRGECSGVDFIDFKPNAVRFSSGN